jgi:hypothetical protein
LIAPRGIQAFWPLSSTFYVSDWNLFRQTERRRFLSLPTLETNFLAGLQELAILVPIAAAIWLVRIKALAGLSAELSSRDHPPQ